MLPKLRDVNLREMITVVPLVILIFLIGLFPNPILTRMHPSVEKVIARAFPPATEHGSAMRQTAPFSPTVKRITSPTGPAFGQGAQVSPKGQPQ